ncbi:hypothetical protein [Streptomyces sp. NPDC005498]|uniref:hypothetical protein n=1 Tax=Streptomyces sp. NPDC005498 TaxID=3364717 RepID=UPI003678594D
MTTPTPADIAPKVPTRRALEQFVTAWALRLADQEKPDLDEVDALARLTDSLARLTNSIGTYRNSHVRG